MRSYFEEAVKEYMDIQDDRTRKVVLNINEQDQDSVLLSLTGKLYQMIVDKVDDIDFGEIPDTKGDIKALSSYNKIVSSIETLTAILQQYKQPTDSIDTIRAALDNLENHKELFVRGYNAKIEIIMVTYCEIALAIVNSISYMIAATIEYIKNPNDDGYQIVLDKTGIARTKDSLIFSCLKKFNEGCNQNQLENAFNPLIKARVRNFTGAEIGVIAGGIAIAGILLNILPILRELTFFYYATRTRISQYFDLQADLLEMNASGIDMGEISTVDDKKKVANRQRSISQFFRQLANKICIDNTAAEKNAPKAMKETDKRMKIDDVVETIPDSATQSLF
jgi:hypothetical protein